MANKKRLATTVGAMALTAVLAIGGTLDVYKRQGMGMLYRDTAVISLL